MILCSFSTKVETRRPRPKAEDFSPTTLGRAQYQLRDKLLMLLKE